MRVCIPVSGTCYNGDFSGQIYQIGETVDQIYHYECILEKTANFWYIYAYNENTI